MTMWKPHGLCSRGVPYRHEKRSYIFVTPRFSSDSRGIDFIHPYPATGRATHKKGLKPESKLSFEAFLV